MGIKLKGVIVVTKITNVTGSIKGDFHTLMNHTEERQNGRRMGTDQKN